MVHKVDMSWVGSNLDHILEFLRDLKLSMQKQFGARNLEMNEQINVCALRRTQLTKKIETAGTLDEMIFLLVLELQVEASK